MGVGSRASERVGEGGDGAFGDWADAGIVGWRLGFGLFALSGVKAWPATMVIGDWR